jgi:hypothetical protein
MTFLGVIRLYGLARPSEIATENGLALTFSG